MDLDLGPVRGERTPAEGRGGLGGALRALAADPVGVPALGVFALLVAWAANQGGYPQTHWAPGGLILLALLAIAVGSAGVGSARTPRVVKVATGALAAYTALSFLTILWAKDGGAAWEGADRTLVYLVVFVLLSTWRRTGRSAALLVCAWVLAMVGLAAFTVVHVSASAGDTSQIESLMPGGRLIFPAGYTNANAAMWMIAAFPALILAGARQLHPLLRGVLAGGAVVLAGVALYSQSRGLVLSTPIVLALVFVLLPGRVRTFAVLVPIAAALAFVAPRVVALEKPIETGGAAAGVIHSATVAVLIASLGVAVIVGVASAIEVRRPLSASGGARLHRLVGIVGVLAAIGVIAVGLIAVSNPVEKVEEEWQTFTSQKGYGANHTGESRLVAGLGSNRFDFYRVAWHEFGEHPVAGIGADNFFQSYLRLRRSYETPHYPHSVEMRTLVETGIVGAIITLVGLAAALAASWRAMWGRPRAGAEAGGLRAQGRTQAEGGPSPQGGTAESSVEQAGRRDPLGRVVAAAALAGFGYWVVHGSFDWFFEYAGLGGAAFALLGVVCSLCPADARRGGRRGRMIAGRRRRPAVAASAALGLACALAGAGSLAAPWLSRMEVQSAAKVWPVRPAVAYARLNEAGRLNPLSSEPRLVAGSIALRLGQIHRADGEFALALERTPGNAYATLERGAIASSRGERARALVLLGDASKLDPRDQLTREALDRVRSGGRVDLYALNRSILREAEQFS